MEKESMDHGYRRLTLPISNPKRGADLSQGGAPARKSADYREEKSIKTLDLNTNILLEFQSSPSVSIYIREEPPDPPKVQKLWKTRGLVNNYAPFCVLKAGSSLISGTFVCFIKQGSQERLLQP
jgi:hypothetical protein